MIHSLIDHYRNHRFAILFCSLLLTLGVDPLLEAFGTDLNVIEMFLALNLLAAVIGTAFDRGMAWLLFVGVGVVVLKVVALGTGARSLLPFSLSLWVVACLLAAIATIRDVLRPGSVNAERIYAALSAYILAALVFGVLYWLIERAAPGSFAFPSSGGFSVRTAIYFSFVTITTLGYGDVSPISEPARSVALVEAMGGQMYLVVLVARLVGLYAASAGEERRQR